MKSSTQSGVSSVPLVLPTNAKHPFAKLVVKGDLGQVVQQWLILQNKCTVGSASTCAVRCELPGIAPYHALLVIGAKQTFIRALAPKLTRSGQARGQTRQPACVTAGAGLRTGSRRPCASRP